MPFVEANLADFNAVSSLCTGIDTVVHLGADPRMEAPWESLLPNNVIGTYNASRLFAAAASKLLHKILKPERRTAELQSVDLAATVREAKAFAPLCAVGPEVDAVRARLRARLTGGMRVNSPGRGPRRPQTRSRYAGAGHLVDLSAGRRDHAGRASLRAARGQRAHRHAPGGPW